MRPQSLKIWSLAALIMLVAAQFYGPASLLPAEAFAEKSSTATPDRKARIAPKKSAPPVAKTKKSACESDRQETYHFRAPQPYGLKKAGPHQQRSKSSSRQFEKCRLKAQVRGRVPSTERFKRPRLLPISA